MRGTCILPGLQNHDWFWFKTVAPVSVCWGPCDGRLPLWPCRGGTVAPCKRPEQSREAAGLGPCCSQLWLRNKTASTRQLKREMLTSQSSGNGRSKGTEPAGWVRLTASSWFTATFSCLHVVERQRERGDLSEP